MRKYVGLLLIVFVLIMSLGVATAQDDPLAGVDPSGATVTYWHEWDGTQGEAITQMIANFNESNEWGITVEEVALGTGSAVSENVSVGITTGDLPNLTGAAFTDSALGWYTDNVLVPVGDYIDHPEWGLSEEERALMSEDAIAIMSPTLAPANGQMLAWPVGFSASVMPTNLTQISFLAENGVIDFDGIPTTWEQFEALVCSAANLEGDLITEYAEMIGNTELTEMRGFPIGGGDSEIVSFIYNFGGRIYDADADRYVYTEDATIAGLQFIQDLYNNGCSFFPEGGRFSNTNNEFGLGFSAVANGSTAGVPFIQGSADSAGVSYEWAQGSMPWVEGSRHILPFLRGIAILEGTPEQNLATWLFIKYWATDPVAQQIWTEGAQYLPYNNATLGASVEYSLPPQFATIATALEDPNITLINIPAHPRSGAIRDLNGELYSAITIGGEDVAEAAARAEEQANEAYDEALEDLADFE